MADYDADRPGLLIHNAREIATLAGGVRSGSSQRDVALLRRATAARILPAARH